MHQSNSGFRIRRLWMAANERCGAESTKRRFAIVIASHCASPPSSSLLLHTRGRSLTYAFCDDVELESDGAQKLVTSTWIRVGS